MGSYMATALEQQAYRRWAAGQVIPDRITLALDEQELYGPEVDLACGVEEPAVDEWEAGTRYPSWEQLQALARLVDRPVHLFTIDREAIMTGPVFICDRSKRKNGCQVVERNPVLVFTAEAIAAANLPRVPPPPDPPRPPTGRRRRRVRSAA